MSLAPIYSGAGTPTVSYERLYQVPNTPMQINYQFSTYLFAPLNQHFPPEHAVNANALLNFYIFPRLPQKSAQLFRQAPSGHFDI